MSDQINRLKQEANETAANLSEDIKKFEQGLKEQVHVGAIIKYEIKEHPIVSVGVAGVLGFATAYWFKNTWRPAIKHIINEFDPELKQVKTAGLAWATKAVTSQLKEAFPKFNESI